MALEAVNRVVMPGDIVGNVADIDQSVDGKGKLKLGPGLRQEKGNVVAFKSGVLRHRVPGVYWIDCSQRRYVPVKGEAVIGIIVKKGETHKVDVRGSIAASLPSLAFEGATKRNKPALQIGDLVYGQFSVANKDMEPELTCVDLASGKSNGLGPLAGGFMFTCSLGLARKLLNRESVLLKLLGKYFPPFECTVGMNGRVWLNCKSLLHTVAICNTITNSEYMSPTQMEMMVRQVVEGIQG